MIHLLQRTRDICLMLLSLVLICNSRYNNNIKIANQLFVKKKKKKKKKQNSLASDRTAEGRQFLACLPLASGWREIILIVYSLVVTKAWLLFLKLQVTLLWGLYYISCFVQLLVKVNCPL